MRKMLMLASVASMIEQFNMSNIQILLNTGYEVHVACNFKKGNSCSEEKINELKIKLQQLNIQCFQIDFARSISKINENFKAYKQVLQLLKNNKYDFIHCHSPIGGMCGRIAAHITKTKVIYTSHGFHFYVGAPIKNWLLYYPIENWLARFTDILITINKEDNNRAKKSFKSTKNQYIPGIGINTKKLNEIVVDKSVKRNELELPLDAFVIISAGELNKNKNHKTIIKAMKKLNNPNIYYIICGQGKLMIFLNNLAKKLGMKEKVKLLGYRTDIIDIYKSSDIFAFPSYREGLSVALMEAMACGLPIICSNIRGNNDLIKNGKGGFLISNNNIDDYVNKINLLFNDKMLRINMGNYNKKEIIKYDIENVKEIMTKVYTGINNIN